MPSIMKGDVLVHMTDNEKRAHDLAIALLPEILHAEMNKFITESPEEEYSFDIYGAYKSQYESMLTLLNRDYPDGK